MGNSLSEIQKKQSFILQYEITELISFFSFEYEIQESVFYSGQGSKLLAKSYLNEETRTRQYLNMMSGSTDICDCIRRSRVSTTTGRFQ